MGPCRLRANPGTIALRSGTLASALLQLPECVLLLILSHLGAKSRAAARLTCRALRHALTGQHSVTIPSFGLYSAKVRLSPRVLGLLLAHGSRLARLEETKQEERLAAIPPYFGDSWIRVWLQSELLASIAREVSVLTVDSSWCSERNSIDSVASGQLHAVLSRMPRLGSLDLNGTLDMPTVAALVDLPSISSVEVAVLPRQDVILRLCHMHALTRLDLGLDQMNPVEEDAWDDGEVPDGVRGPHMYRQIIQACGRLQALRHLNLPCPGAAVKHLSALTRINTLHVRMWDAPASLSFSTRLSALESLRIEVMDWRDGTARFESLTTLTALSRLTSLQLCSRRCDSEHWVVMVTTSSEMSVLSQLTALRVLKYEIFVHSSLVGADPLPVQLHVLTSAAALVTLELAFSIFF